MSSAHLPSQVPAITEYERGIHKGIELALRVFNNREKVAGSNATDQIDYIGMALLELAK